MLLSHQPFDPREGPELFRKLRLVDFRPRELFDVTRQRHQPRMVPTAQGTSPRPWEGRRASTACLQAWVNA